jgi:hypothetical protein
LGIDKKMSKEELIEFEGLVIETCMGRISESDNETHCALAPCDRRCLNFGGVACQSPTRAQQSQV